VDFKFKERYSIEDLDQIVALLRSENGCPWDMVQTHQSIRPNLIEEAYEVVEAIDLDSPEMLREELGDLLLQIIFHSRMENEKGSFSLDDVANDICVKLVQRHPHVFGTVQVDSVEQVLDNWDAIKARQKDTQGVDTLRAVPKVFPSLMRAQKVAKRAGKLGFGHSQAQGYLEDAKNAVLALERWIMEGEQGQATEELGNLLFSSANIARFIGIESEECLEKKTDAFILEVDAAESRAASVGSSFLEQDESQ